MIFPKQLIPALKRLAPSCEGSALVELGLLLPMLAGMIVPLTDLGMGAYAQMQLQNAVQAGAETALASGFNPTKITTSVTANGASLSSLVVATPTQRCGCSTSSGTIVFSTTQSPPGCYPPCPSGGVGNTGTYVTVSATAQYTPLFNYPGISNPVNLSGISVIRIQ